jgi:hypothetical protein
MGGENDEARLSASRLSTTESGLLAASFIDPH